MSVTIRDVVVVRLAGHGLANRTVTMTGREGDRGASMVLDDTRSLSWNWRTGVESLYRIHTIRIG